MALRDLIYQIQSLNGTPLPYGEDLVIIGRMYEMLFASVPTQHLLPLFQHVLTTMRVGYPIAPKDLIAEWNTRYEEEPGMPKLGYSWARDEQGRFISYAELPEGVYPLGGSTYTEELALAKEEKRKYMERQKRLAQGGQLLLEGGKSGYE